MTTKNTRVDVDGRAYAGSQLQIQIYAKKTWSVPNYTTHLPLSFRQEPWYHRRPNDVQVHFIVQASEASELLLDRRGNAVRHLRGDHKTESVESGAVT